MDTLPYMIFTLSIAILIGWIESTIIHGISYDIKMIKNNKKKGCIK